MIRKEALEANLLQVLPFITLHIPMTRIGAILLIFIHLVSTIGYFGIFARLEHLNDKAFSARLDSEEISGSETITVKMPFTLPYELKSHNNNYERAHGELELDGEVYRKVKQKIYGDTLYVVLVKDEVATKLQSAIKDYASSLTEHRDTGKNNNTKQVKIAVNDYEPVSAVTIDSSFFFISLIGNSTYSFPQETNDGFDVDQPPRA